VALVDTLLLYRFFTVQLPQYKRIEALNETPASDTTQQALPRPLRTS
jgi:hypothetical protein